jgi:hypothetical protein
VIDLLLDRFAECGRVLLISNDATRLRDRLGRDADEVLVASDVLDVGGDEHAQMFLDFCILTSAERVIADASVFAILPALIGGGEVLSPEAVLDGRRVVEAVWGFVREEGGRPDLEVGLACSFLEDRLGPELSDRERDELLDLAVAADPKNPTFVLARTAALLRRGDERSAEELLEGAASAGLPEYCLRLVEHSFDIVRGVGFTAIDGGFLKATDWTTLENAEMRSPWVAFYVGLHRMAQGHGERAAGSLKRAATLRDLAAAHAALALNARSQELAVTPSGVGFSNAPASEDMNPRAASRPE